MYASESAVAIWQMEATADPKQRKAIFERLARQAVELGNAENLLAGIWRIGCFCGHRRILADAFYHFRY